MQEVQLYIDGQRVELFKDETISLTQTIQNVKDISKVFTDFSKTFNVPASRDNNKLFKHYYNADIVAGFDARVRVEALIKLNGIDFRKGKIRLDGVQLKDNKASNYKLTFFGETIGLSDILGEDKLADLDFNYLNHDYGVLEVLEGLQTYIHQSTQGQGDDMPSWAVIYPLISREQRYTYDNAQVAGDIKYTSSGQSNGVVFDDLKPALRCWEIIKAIESKYSIDLSTDFLSSSSNPFNDLYLWLNRTKGVVNAPDEESAEEKSSFTYGFNYDSGDGDFVDFTSGGRYWNASTDSETFWDGDLEITPNNSNEYDVLIRNSKDGTILLESLANTGTKSFSVSLPKYQGGGTKEYLISVTITTTLVNSYSAEWDISRTVQDGGGGTFDQSIYDTSTISFVSEVIVSNNVPDLKVIDFLTGIFKLYNLTAYVEDDVIVVKTLDEYYDDGTERDITSYVDVNTLDITSASLYKEISFKYEEAKTFLIQNANKLNNDDFGDLDYTDDDIDGGKYEIKVPFEHMMYERLISGVQYGWFVDEKQEPLVSKPLLFYNENQYTSNPIAYVQQYTQSLSAYNRPSNTLSSSTLNFGSEIDEFTLETDNDSLFETFYKEYVESIFNSNTRIYKLKAFLPLSFLLNYSLADTLVVDGKKYRINSINSNLQTGESKLELINIV